MEGKGKIVSVKDGKAIVRIQKSSACGHDCGECNLCSNPVITTEILNPINAVPGDTVVIGTKTSSVLWWAFSLYILPIIGAMVLYAILDILLDYTVFVVLGVVSWFALWFVFIRRYSRKSITMSSALEVITDEKD